MAATNHRLFFPQVCIIYKMCSKSVKDFFGRVFPIVAAGLTISDIVLDIIQTHTYYAYNVENSTDSATFSINENKIQLVPKAYFYVALAIWALPPVVYWLITTIKDKVPGAVIANSCFDRNRNCLKKIRSGKLRIILACIAFPLDILAAFTVFYIFFPFKAVYLGFQTLRGIGTKTKNEDDVWSIEDFKYLEQFTEALPQLILTAVFFILGHAELVKERKGVSKYNLAIVSMVFSSVLVFVGLVKFLILKCRRTEE